VTLALALGALATGCGPPDPGHDAGPEARLELGTGDLGEFEAVNPGDAIELVPGCQGLQHVAVAVRVFDMNPVPAIVRAGLYRAGDGELVSINLEVRIRFEDHSEDGYHQTSGLNLVVREPELVLGGDILYRVRVIDADRRVAEGEAAVTVEWGIGCTPPDGGADAPLGDG
jgi:hypothetical protein